jgi:hypothetical protein
MSCLYLIILLSVIVFMIFYFVAPFREGFELAKRFNAVCPIYQPEDIKSMPRTSFPMVITGYNYVENPIIYRDGSQITPEQFFRDGNGMAYYMTVYAPRGACNHEWMVETSDYVKPNVANGIGGKFFKVSLLEMRDGHNLWKVDC